MQFNVGFKTDVGRKRQQNQDNGAAFPDLGLFVLADGMGGHRGGEIASAMVVEVMPQVVQRAHQSTTPLPIPQQLMTQAIQESNNAIFEHAKKTPDLQGMGTTTTALLFSPRTLTIGHVGDSRCYYLRPGAIWQVTRDHSLVQEKLRAGIITRDQVKTDRMKNVITRSVGFESELNVEIYEMPIQVGDTFITCSDGLSGMLEDTEILSIVQKSLFEENNIQKAVDELIAAANQNGGDDNVTVLAVQVTELGN